MSTSFLFSSSCLSVICSYVSLEVLRFHLELEKDVDNRNRGFLAFNSLYLRLLRLKWLRYLTNIFSVEKSLWLSCSVDSDFYLSEGRASRFCDLPLESRSTLLNRSSIAVKRRVMISDLQSGFSSFWWRGSLLLRSSGNTIPVEDRSMISFTFNGLHRSWILR